MTTTIANKILSASVSATGAELQSLTSLNSGEEFIWQGDPDVWVGRAPVLFPIVGVLQDGTLRYEGESYPIAKHGLARQAEFSLEEADASNVSLALSSSPSSLQCYPWEFKLLVTFTLLENSLQISYRVDNLDHKPMLFSIGSHPAFRLPVSHTGLEDFSIHFDQRETFERYTLNGAGLLSAQPEPFASSGKHITLTATLFDRDALIFKNIESREVSLMQRNETRLKLSTGGAPHLGIWAKPGAPFVCIEPWHGYNDGVTDSGNFAEKPSMLTLQPGQHFDTKIDIEISPALT